MKKMKFLILSSTLILSINAWAGTETNSGNGGGVWVCQNSDALRTIRWLSLVDFYEGRNESEAFYGTQLEIPEIKGRNYLEIVGQIMIHRLRGVHEGLYKVVNAELDKVKANMVMVTSDLAIVDDALYRIRPSQRECRNGIISYLQLANYTSYGKILVQKNIFEDPRFGETDKAALLIHEAVYAALRKRKDDKNSVRARQIVALLFSTITQDELNRSIRAVLSGRRGGNAGEDCPEYCMLNWFEVEMGEHDWVYVGQRLGDCSNGEADAPEGWLCRPGYYCKATIVYRKKICR